MKTFFQFLENQANVNPQEKSGVDPQMALRLQQQLQKDLNTLNNTMKSIDLVSNYTLDMVKKLGHDTSPHTQKFGEINKLIQDKINYKFKNLNKFLTNIQKIKGSKTQTQTQTQKQTQTQTQTPTYTDRSGKVHQFTQVKPGYYTFSNVPKGQSQAQSSTTKTPSGSQTPAQQFFNDDPEMKNMIAIRNANAKARGRNPV